MAGNIPGATATGPNSQSKDRRQAAAQIPEIAVRARPRADLLTAPIVEKEADRRAAILDDKPATFYLADNPDAKVKWLWAPWYGKEVVQENDTHIVTAAQKAGIDPDVLRSVVYLENANGFYDSIKPNNKTIRPGNINPELWGGLGITREEAKDPAKNLNASAELLGRIAARTYRPTVAKIADLYNGLGLDQTSDYGKTVAYYTQRKPWLDR